MSAETTKVDVLKMMDDAVKQLHIEHCSNTALLLQEARAAVAELIREAEMALECISAAKYPATHHKLRAAVARIGGEK